MPARSLLLAAPYLLAATLAQPLRRRAQPTPVLRRGGSFRSRDASLPSLTRLGRWRWPTAAIGPAWASPPRPASVWRLGMWPPGLGPPLSPEFSGVASRFVWLGYPRWWRKAVQAFPVRSQPRPLRRAGRV